MNHANLEFPGSSLRLGVLLAALTLAACAGKSVPMQSTDSGSGSANPAAGASAVAGSGNAAGGAASSNGAAAVSGAGESRGRADNAAGDRAGGAAAGSAAAAGQQDPRALENASRRAEEAAAAERARQAEAEAAERARQAELEAAERERRGRVETAANQVLIGENEKLQTLDGLLPAVLNMDDKGQFEFDSYALSDGVKAQLDEIAARLADAPYDRLFVVGFTDRIGSEEYNQKLSEKRAWSVAGYLMDKGVPPYKLKVEGKGEAKSLLGDQECTGLKRDALIECLQRDRRVELVATMKEINLKVQ